MLELAGVRVDGISVGGMETCIDLPQLGFAFDIGRCPAPVETRPTVLFTHGHIDHMGGVAAHAATRALKGMPPPTYVVPRVNEEPLRALFAAWRRLDGGQMPHELVPLAPGEEWTLPNGLVARPFHSPHRAPCQGYGIWETKRKLKPEYRELSEHEIRNLRVGRGVEVTDVVETPLVAFTGDARIEVVEREEVVRTARLLVLEVTFLDERVTVESARDRGHIHLDEVIERAELFENEALLFTHFSSRYRADEIASLLARKLPPSLKERVTPLLTGHA